MLHERGEQKREKRWNNKPVESDIEWNQMEKG